MSTTTILGLSLTLTRTALSILRLTPLISSTASLTHAYMEYITTSSFLSSSPAAAPPTTSTSSSRISSRSMLKSSSNATSPTPTTSGQEPSPRNQRELEDAKQLVLPPWFTSFFTRAIWSVIGLNTLTLFSSAANVFLFPFSDGLARKRYYAVGLAAALAHYAFVPLVAPSVEALFRMCASQSQEKGEGKKCKEEGEKGEGEKEGEKEKSAVEEVREWIGYHRVRMCSVDLVAWVCFFVGAVGVVQQQRDG